MAIKSGFETTAIKKENQLTFPALYIWTVAEDDCFGSVNLFINEYTSTYIINGKRKQPTVGTSTNGMTSCNDPRWRRLAIGERIFLENSD